MISFFIGLFLGALVLAVALCILKSGSDHE